MDPLLGPYGSHMGPHIVSRVGPHVGTIWGPMLGQMGPHTHMGPIWGPFGANLGGQTVLGHFGSFCFVLAILVQPHGHTDEVLAAAPNQKWRAERRGLRCCRLIHGISRES